jgi:signal transduction histidine kinase
MAATAAAIGADRLDERVPMPRAHDELAELALTLNTMLERIAGALAQQRRLVADASHELRTPLTAMGAEIDVSLHADDLGAPARRVLLSVREEVDRLGRLVEDLLLLAAADDGRLSLRREPVALMALAREGVRDLEPFARRRDVAVVVGGDADITVAADPDALSRVVRNLVENAIEFSPRGRPVRVTVAAPAIVEVADEGPGIPDALRERVFDRFFRLDPSRSRSTGGTGLGLAIAREIAEAHGGRLTVAEGDRGARLRLTLR